MRPSGVMNGPPSNSCPIVYDELRALAARGGLVCSLERRRTGQGLYDARAEQWRARLPVNAEEQANDAGPSGGDESCFERSGAASGQTLALVRPRRNVRRA